MTGSLLPKVISRVELGTMDIMPLSDVLQSSSQSWDFFKLKLILIRKVLPLFNTYP
jgi:hypothetical protein